MRTPWFWDDYFRQFITVPSRPYMDIKVKTLSTINDDIGVLLTLYHIRPGIRLRLSVRNKQQLAI